MYAHARIEECKGNIDMYGEWTELVAAAMLIWHRNVGIYPPQVKVYELSQLSMKFERHLDSEIIDFQVFLHFK